MENREEKASDGGAYPWIWLASSAVVIAIWGGLAIVADMQGDDKRGTFGDMFGASTSLFTGLAFVGLIITIVLQMKELRLQRFELRDTREVLESQKAQMEAQAITLHRQAADANFFRLLEMFRHMAQNMRHPGGVPDADSEAVYGKLGLAYLHGDPAEKIIGVEYWRMIAKVCLQKINGKDPLDDQWKIIYNRWDTSLAAYFSTLAELLALIADKSADPDLGFRWARTLRAQLGQQEMIPIFLHGLSPWGKIHLKGYIEEFGIFTYFSEDPAFALLASRDLYAPEAFKAQASF